MNATFGGTSYEGSGSYIKDTMLLKYLAVSAELVCILFIVFGNSLVVIAVLKEKQLQTATHWYLFNLAISDLLMGGMVAPMDVFLLLISAEQLNTELMRSLFFGVCVFKNCVAITSISAGGFTAVSIAMSRLLVVLRPTIQREPWFNKAQIANFVIIWLLATSEGIIYVSGRKIHTEDDATACLLNTLNEKWINKAFFSQPLIFGILVGIAYITIVIKLRNRPANIRRVNQDKDKRLTYIVFGVVTLFLLCWSPSMIYVLSFDDLNYDIFKVSTATAYANSFMNPIIYWLTMSEGREFIKKFLCQPRCCAGKTEDVNMTNIASIDAPGSSGEPHGSRASMDTQMTT